MKHLINALALIGAFLFIQPANSQETPLDYSCPDGGVYENNPELGHICSESAPLGQTYYARGRLGNLITGSWSHVVSQVNASWTYTDTNTFCIISYSVLGGGPSTVGESYYISVTGTGSNNGQNTCNDVFSPSNKHVQAGPYEINYACPPDNSPKLINLGGDDPNFFCWESAVLQNDCPEQNGDCDPPPEECPPDTIGGCPPPEPDCVPGGSGMLVCRADPDEKCTTDSFGQLQCEEGCGYINDEFMCLTEPNDLPDFNKCKFTTNGYACPSEPDDEIANPDTPLPDLKKSDFKDVNKGIETRQSKTNDLLETQMGEDKANTKAVTDSVNNMNNNLGGKLDGIGQTLDGIGEGIDGIAGALKPADNQEVTGSGTAESWWESRYEDGIGGVWAKHSGALMQTPVFEFIQQFQLAPSGTQPDWNWCFNLGSVGNFGCHNIEIPSIVWVFIRLVMIITATFAARRIIFGG